MSSIPLLLKNIVNEISILRELIQDSIAPLRNYWNVNRVIGFISNAAFFSSGFEVLTNLAPYILSTFIIELCKRSEDPLLFHDPWTNRSMSSFQHILYVFSLNTKCEYNKIYNKEKELNIEKIHSNLNLRFYGIYDNWK